MKGLYDGLFTIGTDFKETFREEVGKLIVQDLTSDFKVKLSDSLIDSYFEQTGETPDSYELTRLATWLTENKETNHVDKVSNEEYPVLSKDQIKVRLRREFSSDSLENTSDSSKHKLNGKRKPTVYKEIE